MCSGTVCCGEMLDLMVEGSRFHRTNYNDNTIIIYYYCCYYYRLSRSPNEETVIVRRGYFEHDRFLVTIILKIHRRKTIFHRMCHSYV